MVLGSAESFTIYHMNMLNRLIYGKSSSTALEAA